MKHRDNRIWLFLGNLSIRHKMLIILFVLLIVFSCRRSLFISSCCVTCKIMSLKGICG